MDSKLKLCRRDSLFIPHKISSCKTHLNLLKGTSTSKKAFDFILFSFFGGILGLKFNLSSEFFLFRIFPQEPTQRKDGSVVTWGDSRFGGDASAVLPKLGTDVVEITGSGKALAARTAEGRVCSWGSEDRGGDCSGVEALFFWG